MKALLKEFLVSPEITKLSQNSQDSYRYSLGYLLRFCRKNRITDPQGFQVYMPDFAKYLETTRNRSLSGNTVQQYLTYAKLFLKSVGHPVDYRYAVSHDERMRNKRKRCKRWFNEAEVERCLEYRFPKRKDGVDRISFRIAVRLMVETGSRVREIANIKTENIDFERYTIFISDSKTEPRSVFFGPETKGLLLERKEMGAWDGHIFFGVLALKVAVREMLEDLGIKKDGRGPHTFRHYCATWLFYRSELRIEDIAILFGTTVETIANTYIHPTSEMLREKVFAARRWDL